jgi:hypothetical protein
VPPSADTEVRKVRKQPGSAPMPRSGLRAKPRFLLQLARPRLQESSGSLVFRLTSVSGIV